MSENALPPPPVPPAGGPGGVARLGAAAEVLLVALGSAILAESILLAMGHGGDLEALGARGLAALVLLQNGLAVGFIVLFLRLDPGAGLAALGFRRGSPVREALLGLSVFPAVLLAAVALRLVLLWLEPGLATVPENPLLALIDSPGDVLIFLAVSILGGGLGEETVRAFVLHRFQSHLGGMGVGLVVWSVAFGAMHWIQGADTAITVGFIGLMLGLLYAWRRNPIAPIVAHGAFDVVQTLLAWAGTTLAGSAAAGG